MGWFPDLCCRHGRIPCTVPGLPATPAPQGERRGAGALHLAAGPGPALHRNESRFEGAMPGRPATDPRAALLGLGPGAPPPHPPDRHRRSGRSQGSLSGPQPAAPEQHCSRWPRSGRPTRKHRSRCMTQPRYPPTPPARPPPMTRRQGLPTPTLAPISTPTLATAEPQRHWNAPRPRSVARCRLPGCRSDRDRAGRGRHGWLHMARSTCPVAGPPAAGPHPRDVPSGIGRRRRPPVARPPWCAQACTCRCTRNTGPTPHARQPPPGRAPGPGRSSQRTAAPRHPPSHLTILPYARTSGCAGGVLASCR